MNRLKDKDPVATIKGIKDTLLSLSIFTTERWFESGINSLFSVRVEIAGTTIGTNGKGATKLLALASAYAEFVERLSNGILLERLGIDAFKLFPHQSFSSLDQFDLNCPLLTSCLWSMYTPEENLAQGFSDKQSLLSNNQAVLGRLAVWGCTPEQAKDGIDVYAYNSLLNGNVGYLSKSMIQRFGSHGMCAGNTYEEALAHGICEIFERYCQAQIYNKELTPPIVPREVIKEFTPNIYALIEQIEQDEYMHVDIHDCSLGLGLPVYCIALYNKHSHKYALNFASSASTEIALERIFTEVFQGRNLDTATCCNISSLPLPRPFGLRRLFKDSIGNYPQAFWAENKSWEFDRDLFLHRCQSNAEALAFIKELCVKLNTDVYVRDVGAFNLPCVHLIVPDFSDVIECDEFFFKYSEARGKSGDLIKQADNNQVISTADRAFFLNFLDYCRKIGNCYTDPFDKVVSPSELGFEPQETILYVLTMGFISIGDYGSALARCKQLRDMVSDSNKSVVSCAHDYIDFLIKSQNDSTKSLSIEAIHQKAVNFLLHFYPEPVVSQTMLLKDKPFESYFDCSFNVTPEVAVNFDLISDAVKGYEPRNLYGVM